nr:S41 family peptidase [uncultured Desulfuromonas sp.]
MRLHFATLLCLCFLLTAPISVSAQADTPDAVEETAEPISAYEHLDQFIDVLTLVQKNYVEQPAMDQLMSGAIKGMLSELDPHSAYMPPKMFEEMQIETMGEFNGLGVEITVKDHLITVIAPIADTPADRAGIRAGDTIVEIDGTLTKDMSIMDAINQMRGPRGSEITLGIMRHGETAPLSFTLTRETIRVDSIRQRLFEPAIGYVRISQFQQRTAQEFKQALKALYNQAGPLQGLLIDLRNNPGGLLDQAVQVCDLFLSSGKIVSTEGRSKADNFTYNATAAGTQPGYPIVVLINEGSASASEIVAGALQDHKRAVILGTGSFGKGSVQSIIPLADHSGLRLTTAYYYTPNGTSIQARGIVPDVSVEQAVWKKTTVHDLTKEKDLTNHLEPPDLQSSQENAVNPDKIESDYQLLRALDLLRGWQQMKHLQPCSAGGGQAAS